MTARTPFAELPAPQQAGILCNDPQFQQFAGTRTVKSGTSLNPSAAAEYVRLICGVNSRAAIATNPAAADRFEALKTEFDTWRGRIAERR